MIDELKKIIAEQFNIKEREVNLETDFYKDLSADSLDLFQVISEIEEKFEIEIDQEDIENIKTVNDAVEYIKNKKGDN